MLCRKRLIVTPYSLPKNKWLWKAEIASARVLKNQQVGHRPWHMFLEPQRGAQRALGFLIGQFRIYGVR
jgi:hypothetical protein